MSSAAQITANRANAQLSTGAKTPEGKANSSLNAVKTGLTGRTVLLPGDDAEAYAQHVQRFHGQYQPADDSETALVQSLADTEWRLFRIPALEAGIYAIGRLELADLFPEQDESVRQQLLEAKIFLTYQRQLNNLSIQENRLRRQREKDLAKLQELQNQRRETAQAEEKRKEDLVRREKIREAAIELLAARKAGRPFDVSKIGFDFSMYSVIREACHLDDEFSQEHLDGAIKAALAEAKRRHPRAA